MRKVKELIENKSLGLLLLSELDKNGNDILHSFTYKCDEIHAKKILITLMKDMPELKEYLTELVEEEKKVAINTMVR